MLGLSPTLVFAVMGMHYWFDSATSARVAGVPRGVQPLDAFAGTRHFARNRIRNFITYPPPLCPTSRQHEI